MTDGGQLLEVGWHPSATYAFKALLEHGLSSTASKNVRYSIANRSLRTLNVLAVKLTRFAITSKTNDGAFTKILVNPSSRVFGVIL